uniref:Uncharacterized protein n=1 Tax=Lepeophtheirus salmonis TaxID=72036 RepID=A0A0K2TTJ3_LEPSM
MYGFKNEGKRDIERNRNHGLFLHEHELVISMPQDMTWHFNSIYLSIMEVIF